MDRKLAKRIQQIDGVKKEGGEIKGKAGMRDVLACEQPSAAQKFSAQEFLKADCSVWKKTKRACRPRGLLESKHIQRRAIKLSREARTNMSCASRTPA